jgi:hypothetical protein
MKFLQVEKLDARNNHFGPDEPPVPVDPTTVLNELFELLEEYAPAWYMQEHHDRAASALQRRQ